VPTIVNIGWAMMFGYRNQIVDHYWESTVPGTMNSLCGRQVVGGSYVNPDGYSGLPKCKNCIKKLEKKDG